ncbi:MAG TPA: hypothetical protein VL371_16520 [Gemmataceae bacterium]|jgi:hypothetical protein|nr:hypothetical protein [Gemmataceae bacterium]
MNDDLAGRKKRARAMLTVLQEEYLKSTGDMAESKEDLEAWLAQLPVAERNRIGGRIKEANAL